MRRQGETGPSRYMSPKEVELELACSRSTVDNLVLSGALKAIKLGDGAKSGVRILRSSFDAYCARRESEFAERIGNGAA